MAQTGESIARHSRQIMEQAKQAGAAAIGVTLAAHASWKYIQSYQFQPNWSGKSSIPQLSRGLAFLVWTMAARHCFHISTFC